MELTSLPVPCFPGDIFSYWTPGSFTAEAIAYKTCHKVSHVETFIGDDEVTRDRLVAAGLIPADSPVRAYAIAARFPEGVGTYPVRLEHLIAIHRPQWQWDQQNVIAWQRSVNGQRYDWQTLFTFLGIEEKDPYDTGMICSEHMAWVTLASSATARPFGNEPCRKVAPYQVGVLPLSVMAPIWAA